MGLNFALSKNNFVHIIYTHLFVIFVGHFLKLHLTIESRKNYMCYVNKR